LLAHGQLIGDGAIGRQHESREEPDRILELAVLVNLEVKVAAGDLHPRAPHGPDDLAGVHGLTGDDAKAGEVEVPAANSPLVHDAHEEAARSHGAVAPAA